MLDWLAGPLCLIAMAVVMKGWPSIKLFEKNYHYYNEKGEEIQKSGSQNSQENNG